MDIITNDWIPFLGGIAILILYLIFSAKTEMGTKLIRRKQKAENKNKK